MNDPKTITIRVTVIPRSSQSKIVEESNDYIKIKLKAAPIKGEANAELTKILAKKYKVRKSRVEIIKGLTKKDKSVRIYLP